MKIDLMNIRVTLLNKLNAFEDDNYNENTYNFSRGYRRCLMDLMSEIESYYSE